MVDESDTNPWPSLDEAPQRRRERRPIVRGSSRYRPLATVEERCQTAPKLAAWFVWNQLRIDTKDPRYEQAISDAMFGIFEAARTHQPGTAAWSTYAVVCMWSQWNNTRASENRLKRRHGETVSLDEIVPAEEPDTRLCDVISDPDQRPLAAVTALHLRRLVLRLCCRLDARSERVIRRRFGLGNGDLRGVDFTLDEIGALLGRNRERVRQIEAKALRWFRHPAHVKELRSYIELYDSESDRV